MQAVTFATVQSIDFGVFQRERGREIEREGETREKKGGPCRVPDDFREQKRGRAGARTRL